MFELVPWRMSREVDLFRRAVDDIMRDFFDWRPQIPSFGEDAWVPSLDLSETDKEFIVRAELPGVDPKEIEVTVNRDLLTIRGERRQEREEKDENFRRVERFYGSFCRSLRLPTEVRADEAEASYDKGVLRIRLPKSPEYVPTRIEVKAA
mgnify:CR=1 FL=1